GGAGLAGRGRPPPPDRPPPAAPPARSGRGGPPAPPPAGDGKPAAAPAPAAPPVAAAPVASPPAPIEGGGGLAIPDPDDWEVPIVCFRCTGEFTVAFRYFRAGVVFSCPHCNGSFVPTLSMVRGVEEALARFHARWARAFEDFHARRGRELEQFEERQRGELERFSAELRTIATREKPPGAPAKRRGFFSF